MFWPRTSVGRINVVLYASILALCVAFGKDLRWAAEELPVYLSGSIGSPAEIRMLRRAERLLEPGGDWERARSLLERSLAIDPTSEARYWLAECHLLSGRRREALDEFALHLETDPTEVRAYLKLAGILEFDGRIDEARDRLVRGRDFFAASARSHIPRPDPSVAPRFNSKAVELHEHHARAAERLEREIERLDRERVALRAEDPVRTNQP